MKRTYEITDISTKKEWKILISDWRGYTVSVATLQHWMSLILEVLKQERIVTIYQNESKD